MIKQKLEKILIIVLLTAFSCAKTKSPFILSSTKNLEILEEKDHKFCNSLSINYDKKDLIKNYSYWNCRLLTAKHHLLESNDTFSANHNAQIIELLNRINSIIERLPQNLIIESNSRVDEQNHRQCLKVGYKIATQNQEEIDDYFSCRQALLTEHKAIPPFFNQDYLGYKNKDYNIDFVINRRLRKSLAEYEKQKAEYPKCVKFNLYSLNFKNCTDAFDKSRACHSKIPKQRNKKMVEGKTECQRQSYIHFPDILIKEDDKGEDDSKKTNMKSDYYNQNSLSSLGLSAKDFMSPTNKDEEVEKEEEKPKTLEDINNYEHLYTKLEIGLLRSSYAGTCQQDVDVEIARYVKSLEMACDELTKFQVIGEDL